MKRLISLFAVLACMAVGYAQSSLVATLNHGESVSVYYGYDALAQAYEAATHGDLITLSNGMFKSVNLAKNITVRGAGAGATDDCTRLDGGFSIIGVPDSIDSDGHLTLEGLYNDGQIYHGSYSSNDPDIRNAHFIKCRFANLFSQGNSGRLIDAIFVQCKISGHFNLTFPGNKFNLFGCYINHLNLPSDNSSHFTFNNCILKGNPSNWSNSMFTNCIIWNTSSINYSIPSSCQTFYCLGISGDELFSKQYPYNRYETVKEDDANTIFKTYTGTYSDTETFELTDEAKAKYIGTDGREVGIYGGNFPFTFKSNLPKITKFNVASQSTEDGKLKVEIEVNGVE